VTTPFHAFSVRQAGSAVWSAGRWADAPSDLAVREGEADPNQRAAIPLEGLMGSERLPRADRVTQVGALAMGRALAGLARIDPTEVSVLTASVMATAYTNERFERRRMESKPPEPRSFPYTAPNAPAGEMAIAAVARGPTLAFVGGPEVGLAALLRAARWIADGRCSRAIVVATECTPPSPTLIAPPGVVPVECAAAVVVERGDGLSLRWAGDAVDAQSAGPLLSVGPLAMLVLAARAGVQTTVRVRSAAGACVEAQSG
jgi:hypothetical protein